MYVRCLLGTAGLLCAFLLGGPTATVCLAQQDGTVAGFEKPTVLEFTGVEDLLRYIQEGRPVAPVAGASQRALSTILPTELHISGKLEGTVCRLTVRVVAVSIDQTPVTCVVGLKNWPLAEFPSASGDVRLSWDASLGYLAVLPGRGRFEWELGFVVPVLQLADGGSVRLELPGAPVTRISLQLPAAVREVKTYPEVPVQLVKSEGGVVAEVIAGPARQLVVRWSERELTEATTPARVVLCNTLVLPDPTGVTAVSELTLRASAPVTEWEISLPSGARLVNVEQLGEVRYDRSLLTQAGTAVLRLTAVQGAASVAMLRLTLRYPYTDDGTADVLGPVVRGAVQTAGVLRLRLQEGIEVYPLSTENLLPADPGQYAEGSAEQAPALVWTLTGQPYRLAIQQQAAPRQLVAQTAALVLVTEGRCDVGVIAFVQGDRPFQDLTVLTPEGTVQMDVATDEGALVFPPPVPKNDEELPERIRVRLLRPSTRARIQMRYTVLHPHTHPGSDPLVVPLPQLIGARLEKMTAFLSGRNVDVTLDGALPGYRETTAQQGAEAVLDELRRLTGSEPGAVRIYTAGSDAAPYLKLHLAKRAIPYYVESEVQIDFQRGSYAVRQMFTVAPTSLLAGPVTVKVPLPLKGSVQWPRGWQVSEIDEGVYRLSAQAERLSSGALSLSWQGTLRDPESGAVVIPLVSLVGYEVAWTRVRVSAPPDLDVVANGAEASLGATGPGGPGGKAWLFKGLPEVISCTTQQLPSISPPSCIVDACRFRVEILEDRLLWDCRWLIRAVQTEQLRIHLPPGATPLEIQLDGSLLTRSVRLRENNVLELAMQSVDPQVRYELRLRMEQVAGNGRPVLGWFSFAPPQIEGAGPGGDTLWVLVPQNTGSWLLFPGSANTSSLTHLLWLAEFGLVRSNPLERWQELWKRDSAADQQPVSVVLDLPPNLLAFHSVSPDSPLALAYARLPLVEAILWAFALSSVWMLVAGRRSIRSLVGAGIACILAAFVVWDPISTANLLFLSVPGVAAGIVVGLTHRWIRNYMRKRELVHPIPEPLPYPGPVDSATVPVEPHSR